MEIVSIERDKLVLSDLEFGRDGETIQKIMDICHSEKHMFMEGYPCGKKARREQKLRLKRWKNCPKIIFVYYITNDDSGEEGDNRLKIGIMASDLPELQTRFNPEEIDYYYQLFLQKVADQIIAL